jgi:hypothetical protein
MFDIDIPDYLFIFVFVIIPILLVAATACYFTSVFCRFARWRRWQVSWFFGLLCALAAGTCAAGVVWLGLALQPGSWGKADLMPLFFWMCVIGSSIGVLPSEIVVWYYRKRLKDADHVV